MKLQCLALRSY